MTERAIDRAHDDYSIGDSAETVWDVKAEEIARFAELSGDLNPLHTDVEYARAAGYEGCVAHGLLLGSKLSGLIGMKLPGGRCLLLEQKLAYPEPVYAGDRVRLTATVQGLHVDLQIVELKVSITKIGLPDVREVRAARGSMTCKILSSF